MPRDRIIVEHEVGYSLSPAAVYLHAHIRVVHDIAHPAGVAAMFRDDPERVALKTVADRRSPKAAALAAHGLEKCRSPGLAGDEPNDRIPQVVGASADQRRFSALIE